MRGGKRANAGRKKIVVDLAKVEEAYARGVSTAALARLFGCSVRAVERLRKRPDVAAAESRGRATFDDRLCSLLWKRAKEGDIRAIRELERRYGQFGELRRGETMRGSRDSDTTAKPPDVLEIQRACLDEIVKRVRERRELQQKQLQQTAAADGAVEDQR